MVPPVAVRGLDGPAGGGAPGAAEHDLVGDALGDARPHPPRRHEQRDPRDGVPPRRTARRGHRRRDPRPDRSAAPDADRHLPRDGHRLSGARPGHRRPARPDPADAARPGRPRRGPGVVQPPDVPRPQEAGRLPPRGRRHPVGRRARAPDLRADRRAAPAPHRPPGGAAAAVGPRSRGPAQAPHILTGSIICATTASGVPAACPGAPQLGRHRGPSTRRLRRRQPRRPARDGP